MTHTHTHLRTRALTQAMANRRNRFIPFQLALHALSNPASEHAWKSEVTDFHEEKCRRRCFLLSVTLDDLLSNGWTRLVYENTLHRNETQNMFGRFSVFAVYADDFGFLKLLLPAQYKNKVLIILFCFVKWNSITNVLGWMQKSKRWIADPSEIKLWWIFKKNCLLSLNGFHLRTRLTCVQFFITLYF